jgi:hypothetical protein
MARCWQLLCAALAAAILALAGCGGSSGAASASPPAAALYGVAQGNLQIAAALYQDAARTPAGFYADPAPPGENYVATMHLRSDDVAAVGPSFELCSDDWNQALQWSETAASSTGSYSNLVGNSSTARYFEFDRLRPGTPPLYLRQRIYLCSYLDRSGAAPGIASGPAGTLNLRPIGADDLRLLSEYLWHFTPWNNYGHAVLVSEADPLAAGPAHTLVVATLVADGAGPGCDRVDVEAWRHSLAAGSGALVRSLQPLWSFNARQGAAGAEACGG